MDSLAGLQMRKNKVGGYALDLLLQIVLAKLILARLRHV